MEWLYFSGSPPFDFIRSPIGRPDKFHEKRDTFLSTGSIIGGGERQAHLSQKPPHSSVFIDQTGSYAHA